MGARKSPEMAKAEALVYLGHTAYSAAAIAGITPSAIYMSPWYKRFKTTKKRKKK